MAKHPPVLPLFLTDEKKKEILEEVKNIEKRILPKIRRRLAKAYEDGDIPENNPFITAHEDLQLAMKRLNELRELLMRSKVFKKEKIKGYQLGDLVSVKLENGKIITFTIVEPEESSPAKAKLSIQSPYGKAVIGKKKNDSIEIKTPVSTIRAKIV